MIGRLAKLNFRPAKLAICDSRYSSTSIRLVPTSDGSGSSTFVSGDESDQQADRTHLPVMSREVLQHLRSSTDTIIDMTFGAGGHSTQILESIPGVKIFALDRDPVAYGRAQELADKYPGRVVPLLGRFSELPQLLKDHQIAKNSIDAFLFDFGCSSMQFDTAERGFSLEKDGPLDMRMDGLRCPGEPTVADVLERIEEDDLARILKVYGQEKRAKMIARAIIEAKYTFRSLKTTRELADLVKSVLGKDSSATKTFHALRIFVNNELNEINHAMVLARLYLKTTGVLITISFHSLEDTIVKRHLTGNITADVANTLALKYSDYNKAYDKTELQTLTDTPWQMVHKHVLTPSDEEVTNNPRARSARFRAITKVK